MIHAYLKIQIDFLRFQTFENWPTLTSVRRVFLSSDVYMWIVKFYWFVMICLLLVFLALLNWCYLLLMCMFPATWHELLTGVKVLVFTWNLVLQVPSISSYNAITHCNPTSGSSHITYLTSIRICFGNHRGICSSHKFTVCSIWNIYIYEY